jgi:O-glycosyl hydrolase
MSQFAALILLCSLVGTILAVPPIEVYIDPTTELQPLYGVGAAMTRASAYVLMQMSADTRRQTLSKLFDPDDVNGGAAFQVLRLPIGTCDFSVYNYSYDDLPEGVETDFALEFFSIDKDKEFLIPALKEVLTVNPRVKIVASPWSAPAWMKAPKTLFGGWLTNDTQTLQTYAQYFRRFVEAYQAEGISIFAITVQNEPRYETGSYPSMRVTPQQEQELSLLIAAAFQSSLVVQSVGTKILVYDHNWDDPGYPITVFQNSTVDSSPWIAGAAFHCYAGDVSGQTTFHDADPTKEIYFTECSGGEWAPDFAGDLVWDMENLVIGSTVNWARTVLKWNLVLDQDYGPHLPSACTNCRGVVTYNTSSNSTAFNEDFYSLAALGIAFRHDIGDHREKLNRVRTTGDASFVDILAVKKKRTDDTKKARLYALLTNPNTTDSKTYRLNFIGSATKDCHADISLLPSAVSTFVVDFVDENDLTVRHNATVYTTSPTSQQLLAVSSQEVMCVPKSLSTPSPPSTLGNDGTIAIAVSLSVAAVLGLAIAVVVIRRRKLVDHSPGETAPLSTASDQS